MAVIAIDITETVNPGFIYSVDDEQVTINAGILVESQQNDGVFNGGQNGSILINNGNVFSGNTGVDFTGANHLITNNATGNIVAEDVGISIESDGVTINNHGTIFGADEIGVDFKSATDAFRLNNSGSIYGRDVGVLMSSDLDGGVITNSGLIRGDTFAIGIDHNGGDVALITNAKGGIIKGTGAAIVIQEGRLSLTNIGTINGDIESDDTTGNVNDTVINRGKIAGQVLLGDGADLFNGKAGAAVFVFGEAGNDRLVGGKQNDRLDGGAGNDFITGHRGKDLQTGGVGADRFDFNSIKDSVKGGKRDKILDFTRSDADKIDLKGIDAKKGGGNQKFKFIGKQDFHDKKGELRYEDKGAKVIVQGDVNGDGKADFEIFVAVGSLNKGDFLL